VCVLLQQRTWQVLCWVLPLFFLQLVMSSEHMSGITLLFFFFFFAAGDELEQAIPIASEWLFFRPRQREGQARASASAPPAAPAGAPLARSPAHPLPGDPFAHSLLCPFTPLPTLPSTRSPLCSLSPLPVRPLEPEPGMPFLDPLWRFFFACGVSAVCPSFSGARWWATWPPTRPSPSEAPTA